MIGCVHCYMQFPNRADVIGCVQDSVRPRLLKTPGPLLGKNAHRLVGWRHVLLDVVPNHDCGNDDDEVAKDDQGVRDRNPPVKVFFIPGDVLRRTPVFLPKRKNEPEEGHFRDDQPKTNQRRNQKKQMIDVVRVGRSTCYIPLQHRAPSYRIKIKTAMTKHAANNTMLQKTLLAIWSEDGVACSMGYRSPNVQ